MNWVKVFNSEQDAESKLLAGKPRLLLINGVKIAMVKFQGRLHAFSDYCPHNKESLSKGTINALGEVICPWHSYRFSFLTGQPADSQCHPLTLYNLKFEPDGIYIAI